MNLRLLFLRLGLPGFIKKQKLKELFGITAQAFGCDPPDLTGLSGSGLLERYARFTKEQAQKALIGGADVSAIRDRLFKGAADLASKIGRGLHLRSRREILTASRYLYKILGIQFRGTDQGRVIITRCFFSAYYSAEVCRLISSLDEGAAFGLSGGGVLRFETRLTEGAACCRGELEFKADSE